MRRPEALLAAALLAVVSACWGGPRAPLGVRGDTLTPCPGTPNCVHTGLRHPVGTEGLYLAPSAEGPDLVRRLAEVVESMPRTKVVEQDERYLHAEATSLLFRFVDDLELLVGPDSELIVRSASRVGKGDLGVNAKRVAELRRLLGEAGLIR
jgi:uncharacterized protein (DUF1499 family)